MTLLQELIDRPDVEIEAPFCIEIRGEKRIFQCLRKLCITPVI